MDKMPLGKVKKMMENIGNQKFSVNVGWRDAEYPKIASIQEYGAIIPVTSKMRGYFGWKYGIYISKSTITIPPRPHRKQTIQAKMPKWKKLFAILLNKNEYDIEKSFNELGKQMLDDYRDVIKEGNFQPLSQATLKIRQRDDIYGSVPLNATDGMLLAMDYWVEKKK
jgi:hypothetical protein